MKMVLLDVWRESDEANFGACRDALASRGVSVLDPYVTPTSTASRDEWIDSMLDRVRRDISVDAEPWGVLGFCAGGRVALEIAARLRDESRAPNFVGLIEAWVRSPLVEIQRRRYHRFGVPARVQLRQQMLWAALEPRHRWTELLRERAREVPTALRRRDRGASDHHHQSPDDWLVMHYTHSRMVTTWTGHVHLFNTAPSIHEFDDNPSLGLAPYLRGGFSVHVVPGDHHSCTQPPHQARLIDAVLAQMS